MRPEAQTRALALQKQGVTPPLTLGFADCMALILGAALMAVAVLWPRGDRLKSVP